MDFGILNSIKLLLNEIFNRDHYNIPLLDGEICRLCGRPIIIRKNVKKTKTNKNVVVVDRSDRVDCDSSTGECKQKMEAYHKECWKKAIK